MYEVFPILAGIGIGFLARRLQSSNQRIIVLVALSIAFGFCASLISGELRISWSYVLLDMAIVMLAAVVAFFALIWWTRYMRQLR